MDQNTLNMFGEAMRMKLDANAARLKELAKEDPAIAEMLQMDSLPGGKKPSGTLRDKTHAAVKRALE